MIANIIWQPEAKETFDDILAYFESEGMYQAAANFIDKTDERIKALCHFPGRGRLTSHKGIRYILIDKHRRMYYAHNENTLGILIFFDARQHPDKSPF